MNILKKKCNYFYIKIVMAIMLISLSTVTSMILNPSKSIGMNYFNSQAQSFISPNKLIWKEIICENDGGDGRILEATSTINFVLSEGDFENRMLSKELIVSSKISIIFYKDRLPTIGKSYFGKSGVCKAKYINNDEEMNNVFEKNPELKDFVNFLPMYKMDPSVPSLADKLNTFQSSIMSFMDPKSASEYLETYKVNLTDEHMIEMMKECISLAIDFQYTGDNDILEGKIDQKYIENLESIKEQKEEYINKLISELLNVDSEKDQDEEEKRVKEVIDSFWNLVPKALYFSHRSMRINIFTYFNENIKKIFNGLNEDSTIAELVQNNLLDIDPETALSTNTFSEFQKDYKIEDLANKVPQSLELKAIKESDQRRKYKHIRQDEFILTVKKFYYECAIVKDFVKSLDSPYESVSSFKTNENFFINVLAMFNKVIAKSIYQTYVDKLLDALINNQEIKELGIDNLSEAGGDELNLLKNDLIISGFIQYEAFENPLEMEPTPFDLFIEKNRRILI